MCAYAGKLLGGHVVVFDRKQPPGFCKVPYRRGGRTAPPYTPCLFKARKDVEYQSDGGDQRVHPHRQNASSSHCRGH